jgi:hypothetical protein
MIPMVTALAAIVLAHAGEILASAVDLSGRPVDPFENSTAKLVVLVFVSTDCPLSNRYAPEVQRLQAEFADRGAAFWLVYPDPAQPGGAIRRHLKDYSYRIPALRDPAHALVQRAKVRVTPEAAVFGPGGHLLYHGRIDDRYVDLGKARAAPTTRDLEAALEAALAGRPVPQRAAPAVGCFISDLK